ncbi:MAG: hypothetical protein A2046_13675 [Bacteroidetes bacterium GWA2_30_7]|nr:MAG: hypothetical protein A2046_13675 [Bacteroidetes bacterium GWA2_30_7]
MSKIRIKNFGPIKEGLIENDGWIDIKKVTVFIGNQDSGKSTVAKVISTLTWIEKAINRGDISIKTIIRKEFFKKYFEYQGIKDYFKDSTEIEYVGSRIGINFNNKLEQTEIIVNEKNKYCVPKIMYVPSERNLLYVIEKAYDIKNLPGSLFSFAEELKKGQNKFEDKEIKLPFGNLKYKYDSDKDDSILIGDDFEVNLLHASSGFQSLVPLYIVSKYITEELQEGKEILQKQLSVSQSIRRNEELATITLNENLSDNEKNELAKTINSKYIVTCFINIVEEPEQNLFPSSQHIMLNNLLELNSRKVENKLIMSTHSPYLINYLTLAVEANRLKDKVKTKELKDRLEKIVPLKSTIPSDDLVIYQLDETDGTIKLLGNYKGLPSDENYLNNNLADSNDLFSQLLDIEDLCQ